jgi:hypothetical protein
MRIYTKMIDGMLAGDSLNTFQTPVLITPGNHFIDAYACYHGWTGCGVYGDVSFTLNFEAGKSYTLRISLPQIRLLELPVSTVWIEDSSGNHVTEDRLMSLKSPGGQAMAVIFVPSK